MTVRVVTFVDTSVLRELLGPPLGGEPQRVKAELSARVHSGQQFVLPVTAVIETGNAIGRATNGDDRRRLAGAFREVLLTALGPSPPWILNGAQWDRASIEMLIGSVNSEPFEGLVQRGISVGDLAVLTEAQQYAQRVDHIAVKIWTLDAELRALAGTLAM